MQLWRGVTKGYIVLEVPQLVLLFHKKWKSTEQQADRPKLGGYSDASCEMLCGLRCFDSSQRGIRVCLEYMLLRGNGVSTFHLNSNTEFQ